MSFIDSELTEECMTDASFDSLEKALKHFGYDVVRTKLQITARRGGVFKTNGKFSTVVVTDSGSYRSCRDTETAKGYLMRPRQGVLAQIVAFAEELE